MTCFSAEPTQKKETKQERTMSYLERLQSLSNSLASAKQCETAQDEKRFFGKISDDDKGIIQRYQAKLADENSRIVSANNRWEVNRDLQDYNQMVRQQMHTNGQNKVSYVHDEQINGEM